MSRYARKSWTASDYTSIRADLIALIAKAFPDWTKTNPADPGMVLAELVAYVGDLVRYYEDRQSNEAFLITSWERRNVINHLKLIGYKLASASAATATLTFTLLDGAQATAVTFAQGDAVTTEDTTVSGELVDTLEIAAGSTTGTVDWIEGQTIVEDLGESDGTASQAFVLAQTPYLDGSETITIDGIVWTAVDNFLSSDAAAQVYTVDVAPSTDPNGGQQDQATITFGDGTNGAIPANGAVLSATYRIGGGTAGNVEAATLTRLAKSYQTAAGVAVRVSVTNAAAASGGTDRETLAHAKVYGPASLAAGGRAVTTLDYQTIAELVPGVARALAQTSNEDATIQENTVLVQIVPVGAGTPTQTLLDAVSTKLRAVMPNTVRLLVVPALYVDVAPVGTAYVARGQAGQTVLATTIYAIADAIFAPMSAATPGSLVSFFDAENIDVGSGLHTVNFGLRVALSQLFGALSVDGVRWADLTSPVADTVLAAKYFPRLRAFTRVDAGGVSTITWTGLGTTFVVQQEP